MPKMVVINGMTTLMFCGKPLLGTVVTEDMIDSAREYLGERMGASSISHQRAVDFLLANGAVVGDVFDNYLKELHGRECDEALEELRAAHKRRTP